MKPTGATIGKDIHAHCLNQKGHYDIVTRGDEIWTVCCVREKLKFQFINPFNGHWCHMRFSTVVTQNNPASTMNSRFQLFKCNTVPYTTDHLLTILAVVKDRPNTATKQC
jgi:hypothetical protein